VQNLGFFPIHGVMMKITVPIATRGGNRLLTLRDFLTDQVLHSGPARARDQKETCISPRHVPMSPEHRALGHSGQRGTRSAELVVRLGGVCSGEHVL
jgi:hypothetical protein